MGEARDVSAMVGSVWSWIGGGISRVAATGLITGLIFVLTGMLPWEYAAELIINPPYWLTNGFTKLILVIVGISLIYASFNWNVWSRRQKAIDGLSNALSDAIRDILNRRVSNPDELVQWEMDYRNWCDQINVALSNRAFFTKSDQIHFDRLGFIDVVNMGISFNERHAWLLSQLREKFNRLRDVINWSQTRRR